MERKVREIIDTGLTYLQTVSDNLTYSKSFISPFIISAISKQEKLSLVGETLIAQTLSGELQKILNDEYVKLDNEMCKYLGIGENGIPQTEKNNEHARELRIKTEELKDKIKEFQRLDAYIDGKSYDLAIACDIPQVFSTTGLFHNEDYTHPDGFSQLRNITEQFEKKISENKTQPIDKFYANFIKPRVMKFAEEWQNYRNYDLGKITKEEIDRFNNLKERFLEAAKSLNEKYKDVQLNPDGTITSKSEKEIALLTNKKNIDEKAEEGRIKGFDRTDYLYSYITTEISQYLSTGAVASLKKDILFDLARQKRELTETRKDGSTIKREGVAELGRIKGSVSVENKRDPLIPDTLGLANAMSHKADASIGVALANTEGSMTREDKNGKKVQYYSKEALGFAEAKIEAGKDGISASATAAATDAKIGKTVEGESGDKIGIEINAAIKAKASINLEPSSVLTGKELEPSLKAGPSLTIKETLNDQTLLEVGIDGGLPKINSPALFDKSSNTNKSSFIKNVIDGLKNLFKIKKSLDINEESKALNKLQDIAKRNKLDADKIKELSDKDLYASLNSFAESVAAVSSNLDDKEILLSQLEGFTGKEQSAICRGLKGDEPLSVQEILDRINRDPDKIYVIEDKQENKTIAANKDWVVIINGKLPEDIKTFSQLYHQIHSLSVDTVIPVRQSLEHLKTDLNSISVENVVPTNAAIDYLKKEYVHNFSGYEYDSFISTFTRSAPCNPGYELTEALDKFTSPSFIIKCRDELQNALLQSLTGKTSVEAFIENQQEAFNIMTNISYEFQKTPIEEARDYCNGGNYSVLFQQAAIDDKIMSRFVIENGIGEAVKEEYFEGDVDIYNETEKLAEESVSITHNEHNTER